jgi:hypothetical protein
MIRSIIFVSLILMTFNAKAGNTCDIRPGFSIGVKVVEFFLGRMVFSKIPFVESTPDALHEEMVSLQDMGLCQETIQSQRCVLKLEKNQSQSYLTLYRGNERWNTWSLPYKNRAQIFVKGMKKVGFCR